MCTIDYRLVRKSYREILSGYSERSRNLIRFGHTHCWIRDSDGKLNGMGTVVDKLYQLNCEAVCCEKA